jgi:SAM-dependent methyltransferase
MMRRWAVHAWRSVLLSCTLILTAPAPLVASAETPTSDRDGVAAIVESSPEHPEERPFIGIQMGSSTHGGTSVAAVISGTAAERFGIEAGDVILRIDEVPTGSPGRVLDALASRCPGDVVEVELLRSGERQTIRLELGIRPDELELRRDRADHVLEVLQIRPGLAVADVGCGSGWLSEAIAVELDGSGTVYAVEVEESHIQRLRRRELRGVVPILSKPDDVSLPENSIDVAMLHDVASHIARDVRKSFYESVGRALRPSGRLVIFGPHGDAETMLEVLRTNAFIPVDGDALDGLSQDQLERRLADGIVFRHAPEGAP